MRDKKLIQSLNLSEGERVKLIVRRYLAVYWWKILVVFILLLLPFFLLYPLFQWNTWGPIIFIVLLFLGLAGLLKLYTSWYFNCLIITSQRIVDFDQRGLFDRTVSEAALNKVEDFNYRRKGIFQSLLNYGIIQYYIAPGKTKIVIRGVKRPQEICQKITLLLDEVAPSKQEKSDNADFIDSVDKLKSLLREIKQELGSKGFSKIVKEIEGERHTPKPKDHQQEVEEFMKEE